MSKLQKYVVSGVCLAVIYAPVAGCGRATAVDGYDKEALAALEPLHPEYKLDYDGRVIELRLEGKQVTDAALDKVKAFTALRTLSLYGSSITDAGLVNLQELGYLQALGLGATSVGDQGLEYLENLRALRWLWITENERVSQSSVRRLEAAFPDLVIYQ